MLKNKNKFDFDVYILFCNKRISIIATYQYIIIFIILLANHEYFGHASMIGLSLNTININTL